MMKALLIVAGLLAALALASPSWAETPAEVCANACGKQYNVCLHGMTPDFKALCGGLAECKDVADESFRQYNSIFNACINSLGLCPKTCQPPAVTTTPAPATGGGKAVPTTPAIYNAYQAKCRADGGYYVKSVVTENGQQITREECYRLKDIVRDVETLKREMAEVKSRLDNGEPATISPAMVIMYAQLMQLTGVVNQYTEPLNQIGRDFPALKARSEDHEKRLGQVERNLSSVARDVAGLKGQPYVPPRDELGPVVVPEPTRTLFVRNASLPCWLAAYGAVNLQKINNYVMGSEGFELGCSLFGTDDGKHSMVLGGGVAYANRYFDHHLMELHGLAGYRYRSEQYEFLITGYSRHYNSTTWERGTISWYGLVPEARYLVNEHVFIGGMLGLGVINIAPPHQTSDMDGQRNTEISAFAGIKVGYSL